MTSPSLLAFVERQSGVPRDDGLLLYGNDDLAERNNTFEVMTYLPDYLLIGDDSGGRGIFLHCTTTKHPVFLCHLGVMDEDALTPLADSLDRWVESGCPLPR